MTEKSHPLHDPFRLISNPLLTPPFLPPLPLLTFLSSPTLLLSSSYPPLPLPPLFPPNRTSAWCISLQPGHILKPLTFEPHTEIASLNNPKPNAACTTHVDPTYPFCVPSTRDTTTLDFYHILLNVTHSAAKPQIFTVLTTQVLHLLNASFQPTLSTQFFNTPSQPILSNHPLTPHPPTLLPTHPPPQECGQFMAKYNDAEPLGHMVASVYRSWAFVQKDTIQEFKSDDGVPYWYHR